MLFKQIIHALGAGLLFALGLVVSGMTAPAKVIGFLNVWAIPQGISWLGEANRWDPSLAFVMGGALLVTLLAYAISPKAVRPWADTQFHLPTRNDIDRKLIAGAALFGVGWALAGYCPGPALASILTGGMDAVAFCVAMLVGMYLARKIAAD